MPVKPCIFNPVCKFFGILSPDFASGTQKITVHQYSANHVQSVQAGESEIDREKRAGAGVNVMMEFRGVFKIFHDQEHKRKKNRCPKIHPEFPEFVHL